MRTVTRFGALALAITAGVGTWWPRLEGATPTVAIRSNVQVQGATAEQLAMAQWALGRFERAGLNAPVVQVRFHTDASGCGGHLGYAKAGRVDICTVIVNEMARRSLLHEMGHIWIDQNVPEMRRERFINLRGLSSWNSSTDLWQERGYEQAAETMAWALGDRILSAQIPDNEPAQLAAAFELLTGAPLPLTRDV